MRGIIKITLFFFLLGLFSLSLSGCLPKKEIQKGGEQKMVTRKKVLIVIAPKDFRDEEYQKPRKVLEEAGYEIVVASKEVKAATGMMGVVVNVDQKINDVKVNDYEAVIFVGGPGAAVYFDDLEVRRIAKEAVQQGKIVGAICIAPSILANAGLLAGKNATCFASEMENLLSKGAKYTGEHVTADGKIVTADGPEAAEVFGLKIVEILRSL